MATVSIRDLANRTKSVVEEVAHSGRPAVITQRGRPLVALVPISEEALEDWVLANAPEFVASMAEADAEIASGVHGQTLDAVLADLEAEESTDRP